MSSYSLIDLTAAIRAIGRGVVFYSSAAFAGTGNDFALTHLGDTEGEITIDHGAEFDELTLQELTGPIAHSKYLSGYKPVVTIPLASADPAAKAIVSPVGSGSGGHSIRQAVSEHGLVIFPHELFLEAGVAVAVAYTTAGGWTVGGEAATTAQEALLDQSIFFWRGHFEPLMPTYRHEDGGKEIQDVVFHAMHNGSMPEGHHIFTLGRPETASIEIASA